MDQEKFEAQHSRTFEALRKLKGSCPDGDVLFAFVQSKLEGEEATAVRAHLSLCGLCQEFAERLRQEPSDVDEVTWKRAERGLDARRVPWRDAAIPKSNPWLGWRSYAAAAAVVLVAAAGLWLSNERIRPGGPVSTTRGDIVQLVEPAGRVERIEEFRWNPLPAAASFRLQVREGEKRIWEAVTADSRYRPPEELIRLLRSSTRFRWRVEALDGSGRLIGESAWTEFDVSP